VSGVSRNRGGFVKCVAIQKRLGIPDLKCPLLPSDFNENWNNALANFNETPRVVTCGQKTNIAKFCDFSLQTR
jgi:hypothetical protein